ncbi:phosphatase PAP2 family protein [Bradyrhizobium sp. LHD-71]|uniref:phosphatase PAP2 family protein n=1 Tax=Bradyrhizobium sp. LHD-71 TaxID=3072141 RepID=UPI00281012C9|nr:phosphatase PAP2 family protein [Bradyrhizobium sp. LHD-71]MDQ8730532.1 phosphatase PAP2 family protein [Bradyrhizobium sp. LHD-71]
MPEDHRGEYPDVRAWLLAAGIAGPLFVFLVISTQFIQQETALDRWLMLAFRVPGDPGTVVGPAWLREASRDVTALGSFTVLGMLCAGVAGVLLIRNDRAGALGLLAAVFGAIVINSLIKLGFARPRPDLVGPLVEVFTASFPSGHAAVSSSTYLTLAILASRSATFRPIRGYLLTLALLLILLIGTSRVYLGVHYPTDILGGWCIGASWAVACWVFIGSRQRRRQDTVSRPRQAR